MTKRRISDNDLYDRILELCAAAGPEKAVRPADIAQDLAGENQEWQPLLPRIKNAAAHQARAGLIHIIRKGKPADPDDFKGVYKLRLVAGADIEAHLNDPTINKGSGAAVTD